MAEEMENTNRRNVQYREWSDLGISDFSINQAKSVVENSAQKFEQYINNELELIVHAKQADADGKQRRHSIHSKLSFPGDTLVGSSSDWDFNKAVHDSLNALEVQLEKRFQK